ncbi:alpha/beta hydrolase fold domain-containing protein [Mangrovivirga sp. M17]|uniref:Alpha/beta hydrolase fold domain-containing protein n=1 Tax=Mangrovivirga halotolerans TaxID=2993936 RepID=A0ABT3RLF5_9BACT|nr:alpha/beta hydrolase fold domain-containing protein [Mangrovivirga halotolerans]MCX2742296.1 alpha/beta hydrolase fold domain-containing protein [Mangrovivirga halotolerans]
MKHYLSLLLFMIPGFLTGIQAQKYYTDNFNRIDRNTLTYLRNNEQILELDYYDPVENDDMNKPLVVYVHGGGFGGGMRNEPKIIDFCERIAKKGYAVASVSYTLMMKGKGFGCDQPASTKMNVFYETAKEINHAIKFLIEKGDSLNINSEMIILSGSSAGAEAIVNSAYWKKTQEGILDEDFKFAGVISMAGAIPNIDWVNDSTAIPTQLFHGTCDNLVPYDEAPHHYCGGNQPGYLMLYGSYSIMKKLQSLGKPFYMVTGCGGGHEWNDRPWTSEFDDVIEFLYQDVYLGKNRQIHIINMEKNNNNNCVNPRHFNFCNK